MPKKSTKQPVSVITNLLNAHLKRVSEGGFQQNARIFQHLRHFQQ
jgi:hypothetical protein